MRFCQTRNSVLIVADISGLQHFHGTFQHHVFAFHIHNGSKCKEDMHGLRYKNIGGFIFCKF